MAAIYQEQISSVMMAERVEFAKVLTKLEKGDVLVFTSLSRVARPMVHMVKIEAAVAKEGATIQILDMNTDTSTRAGRLTFNMFASIAQFKRENMLERQKVGIAAAKEEGKYTGRVPTAQAKAAQVLKLYHKGLTKEDIAKTCEIAVASIYRIAKANKTQIDAAGVHSHQRQRAAL
ncbi:recombinase family protein [Undibacterium sp. CY21W]|uniref:recombinase family protein n=1 Tax=Undibacterium sp. CY21W TaxID=2762293 RepID=UPI00164C43E7|nr:recombinase family protein [Undibacterium sp. CY21W]MBC3928096.1 recombinase family protein [Undibacterium sp. CY21W]